MTGIFTKSDYREARRQARDAGIKIIDKEALRGYRVSEYPWCYEDDEKQTMYEGYLVELYYYCSTNFLSNDGPWACYDTATFRTKSEARRSGKEQIRKRNN
jgi:hypothetical protein